MVESDPLREAHAYQRSLLAALGIDDPEVAQAGTGPSLRALATEAGKLLRTRPEPGEWSVLECIGHIVDAELVVAARYRWILAHDEPDLVGYDQARWVERLRHNQDDVEDLLTLFDAIRASNITLWSRLSSSDRSRVGMHLERGPESLDLTFRLAAGHDRVHLAQARRALDSARRAEPTPA